MGRGLCRFLTSVLGRVSLSCLSECWYRQASDVEGRFSGKEICFCCRSEMDGMIRGYELSCEVGGSRWVLEFVEVWEFVSPAGDLIFPIY